MDKSSITFEELCMLLDRKYYFTKERFYNYFNILGVDNKDVEGYWLIWERFPHFRNDDIEKTAFIVEKLLLYPNIKDTFNIDSYSIRLNPEYKPNRMRIYYKNRNEIKNFEIDFDNTDQVILYADFLKKNVGKIITAVDFIEEIYKDGKTRYVYDGDVFSLNEKWNKDRDGKLFACTREGYRKLLYTSGKGYLRNGEPDYDDSKYNHHVITGADKFKYIGNIYADPSFLIEQGTDTEKGGENAND